MSARRLLIDSCVARTVGDRLRSDGHDVVAVRDLGPDPGDRAILELAVRDQRILVTIDADFGTLVFRDHASGVGVLRLRERPAAPLAERASELIAAHGDDLAAGCFVTDDGETARITRR